MTVAGYQPADRDENSPRSAYARLLVDTAFTALTTLATVVFDCKTGAVMVWTTLCGNVPPASWTVASVRLFIDGVSVIGSRAVAYNSGVNLGMGSAMVYRAALLVGVHTFELKAERITGAGPFYVSPVALPTTDHAAISVLEVAA